MKRVQIFTDGACSGNPGPGGWGTILRYNGVEKELSGGERVTTNNRMELTAAIEALRLLKRSCSVDLYTDSAYLCNAFEKGWLDIMLGTGRNSFRTVSNITENWKSFYDGARKLISSENGFADLTDAFDEISGVYIDGIHCCEVGNEILAGKIRDVILADQLKEGSKFSIETEADV